MLFRSNTRDLLNYAAGCKAAIDGLVDARLMLDDNWTVMDVGDIKGVLDRDKPRCEILIERIE